MRPNYLKYFDCPTFFYDGDNYIGSMISDRKRSLVMKSLPFQRDEKKSRVTVACANGDVSVYSRCAYCRHCKGVMTGNRVVPTPQMLALSDVRRGVASDDNLMNAAMMFNTLVRDGSGIECDDDANEGYQGMY